MVGRLSMFKNALLLFLFSISVVVNADEIELKFDRTQFSLEEPFDITITSSNANSGTIDLSLLTKDFEILGQHKQTSMQIINGAVSQSLSLIFTVAAKQAGDITIPPMVIGQDTTREKTITIKEESQTAQGKDILLEAAVEQDTSYVQGQVIYVQRLLFSKDLGSNSTLTRPKLKEGRAEIESLGNTPEQVVQRNGRDYRMITRRFAIIPQESGKIVFAPTVFSGATQGANIQQFDRFGFTSTAKRMQVRSNEVSVEIKPRPTNFTGKDWIVAKDFSLHLNWPVPTDQLKAGEPVTVVLAAIADGLRAEQLAEIEFKVPDAIKQYPEKPTFKNIRKRDGIVGTVNQSIVLVATGGGTFQIPEIKVPWWNSQTDKEEVAVLAATDLKVSGKPVAIPVQKMAEAPATMEEGGKPERIEVPTVSKTLILLLTLALFAVLLLFTWWVIKRKGRNPIDLSTNDSKGVTLDCKQILMDLEKACLSDNALAAQAHLQDWAGCIDIFPPTLEQLSQQTNESLRFEIRLLSQSLYGRGGNVWQGKALWKEVSLFQSRLKQAKKEEKPKYQLEPLYL